MRPLLRARTGSAFALATFACAVKRCTQGRPTEAKQMLDWVPRAFAFGCNMYDLNLSTIGPARVLVATLVNWRAM